MEGWSNMEGWSGFLDGFTVDKLRDCTVFRVVAGTTCGVGLALASYVLWKRVKARRVKNLEAGDAPEAEGKLRQQENRKKLRAEDCPLCVKLLDAAGGGDMSLVQRLLEQGADPDCVGKDGYNVLHKAVWSGNIRLVDYLLRTVGLGINERTEDQKNYGLQAVHIAAGRGSLRLLRYLLSQGASKNYTTSNRWSILHYAAYYGRLDVAKYCVQCLEMDIKATTDKGETPLDVAKKGCDGRLSWALVDYLRNVEQRMEESPRKIKIKA